MATIVIVEDDPGYMNAMATALRSKGHTVWEIGPACGLAMPGTAKQIAKKAGHPRIAADVILLDSNLGFDPLGMQLKGEEVAKELPPTFRIVNISSDRNASGVFGQTSWWEKQFLNEESMQESFLSHIEQVLATPAPE